jgi:chromosome partitioning protein
MRTIALVTRKGGSGKTTLATSLAVAAATTAEKVVALDFDLQESLTR